MTILGIEGAVSSARRHLATIESLLWQDPTQARRVKMQQNIEQLEYDLGRIVPDRLDQQAVRDEDPEAAREVWGG